MRENKIIKYVLRALFYIISIPVMVIGFIGVYAGITLIQEKLFVKGDYITFVIKYPYAYLVFAIMIILVMIIGIIFSKKEKFLMIFKGSKFMKFSTLAVIPLIYIVLTSIVVVTEEGIYDYSFYNIKGNRYSFEEVEYVQTGFVNSGKNKGNFYYNIEFTDGVKLKLAYPSIMQPSEKYEGDAWKEYVDIDKNIMDSGAEKESSEEGSQYVAMDKIYVDRLMDVIGNRE